ncbi:hypothetical protein AMATHDRAFT_61073 [Amanita thiersii Skay4041]|uniref:L-type lectin-like domain-containing protein n=1 Tax=Amanita thiersii Skay4041 TaxID=703135 RepID=A0A2A9NQ82_9AGAR|nr:hypothetical protein AMATHDRAFT_61073 [Amanita thiersii Skay4041]
MGNVEKSLHLPTHSLYAPYIDQDLQNRWWDFGADAYVNTNKHVRLTRPVPSQMGWLWSRLPLSTPSFVIDTEFKVSGESTHLFGDGLAMWITTERTQEGPIFGNKDKFRGLGIFLDTYANSRHGYSFPRISGMIGDGQTSFDFGNDGDSQVFGGCSANFRRTNVVTKLRVIYIKEQYLDVKVQYKAWDEWTDCFRLENVTLPTNPFVGYTAMTGDVADAHDIITVSTHAAYIQQKEGKKGDGKKSGPIWKSVSSSSSTSSSFSGTLFKLVLLGAVCYGLFYAWKRYAGKNKRGYYGGVGSGTIGGGFGGAPMGSPMGSPAMVQTPRSAGGFGGAGIYENRKRF